jgi:hypothetical protein
MSPDFPGPISSPAAVCPSMHEPLANTRFLKLCDALATCQRCEGRGICPGLRKGVGVGAPTKGALEFRCTARLAPMPDITARLGGITAAVTVGVRDIAVVE